MTAWVHRECDIMDEDTLLRLQGAWENQEGKDACVGGGVRSGPGAARTILLFHIIIAL